MLMGAFGQCLQQALAVFRPVTSVLLIFATILWVVVWVDVWVAVWVVFTPLCRLRTQVEHSVRLLYVCILADGEASSLLAAQIIDKGRTGHQHKFGQVRIHIGRADASVSNAVCV